MRERGEERERRERERESILYLVNAILTLAAHSRIIYLLFTPLSLGPSMRLNSTHAENV